MCSKKGENKLYTESQENKSIGVSAPVRCCTPVPASGWGSASQGWNKTAKSALSAAPGYYQKQEKERHERQEIKW